MILSYARRNDIEQATKYFNMMENQYCLSPSVRSYNAMIYAHSNDGNVQGALRYLEKMIIAKVTPGIETFNYTIRAHVRANDKDGALSSFNFFRNKFKLVPNVITMNMMIELNILNNDKGKSLSPITINIVIIIITSGCYGICRYDDRYLWISA